MRWITEADPGEMWFIVGLKGLQRFRCAEGSWRAFWSPVIYTTDPAVNKRLTENQSQKSMSILNNPGGSYSSIAPDPRHGRVLLTATDWEGGRSNEKSNSGGLLIFDYRDNGLKTVRLEQGLPSNQATAVATDGRFAWGGGRGYVAVVDVDALKVLRIGYMSAGTIQRISTQQKVCVDPSVLRTRYHPF